MAVKDLSDGRTGTREERTAALQALARDVFGREMSADDAWRLRERLPTLAEAVRLIEAQGAALDSVTPATVFSPVAPGHGDV